MRKMTVGLAVAALAVGIYALVTVTGPRTGRKPARETGQAGRQSQGPEKVFTFNNRAEPKTLDPALMTSVAEMTLADALFEGLVNLDPKTLRPEPGVAERWEVSADGLRYTFHLRACSWSNGDTLTAEDFVYSWRRVLDPATAAPYAYQLWYIKKARGFTKGEVKNFSEVGIRAPNERTIEVTLEHPTAYFLELAAFPTYRPVHRGCVEMFGAEWTRPGHIIGNGAFVMEEWQPQDRIVMVRNERYWDAARVKLNRAVALAIVDENTALRRYKTGDIDWLPSIPGAMAPQIKGLPDYHQAMSLGVEFYRFNCTRKPFDDARVRTAFDLALDKAKLCEFALEGLFEPAATFVPPMLAPYKSPAGLAYDPQRAAELLAEAGYPGGMGFPRVTLIYNTNRRHEQAAAVAQNMWKEVLGVEVNLVSQEFQSYLTTMQQLDYDIMRSGWVGDYTDPNTFLDMFVTDGGNNRTGWSNERYDALIEEAERTADAGKRLGLLREAEDILINREMPIVPLYFDSNIGLVRPRVRGFCDNARNLHPLKYVDLNHK